MSVGRILDIALARRPAGLVVTCLLPAERLELGEHRATGRAMVFVPMIDDAVLAAGKRRRQANPSQPAGTKVGLHTPRRQDTEPQTCIGRAPNGVGAGEGDRAPGRQTRPLTPAFDVPPRVGARLAEQ